MILVFPSSNFLTDRSKAVLLYLCSSLTNCLVCVLQPSGHLLGKWLWPSSPVSRSRAAGHTFLVEYVFRRVPFSHFGLFFAEHTSVETIYTETLQALRMS